MEQEADQEAFVRLYAAHEKSLRRYVRTLLFQADAVDEVMQETAVALWRKFSEYDASRGFLSWAFQFAYYEVLKHRRQRQSLRRHFSDAAVEALAAEQSPTSAAPNDRQLAVARCLASLRESDRRTLLLRYEPNQTVRHMAEGLGQSVEQVYRALERIRRALVSCVERRLKSMRLES